MSKEKKDIAIRISNKNLLDEYSHSYTDPETGEIKESALRREIRMNLGTPDQPRWGRLSVYANRVHPARDFSKEDKPQLEGVSVVFFDPEHKYTVKFSEPTGKQIEDKNGKLVNEWVDVAEKISGKEIAEMIKENYKQYKEKKEKNKKSNAR